MFVKHAMAFLGAIISAPLLAQEVADAPGPQSNTAAAMAAPALQGGKIIFWRPASVVGFGLGCPIRYEGREIVELGRGKFAEWAVPAGRWVVTNKTSSVEVVVAPGETRYVRCVIKPGFMTGRADLQIADHASFAEHQADYEQKEVAFTPVAEPAR